MKNRSSLIKDLQKAARRFVHALARPGKAGRDERSGMLIYPYRGYGSRCEVFLMGRVFKQKQRVDGAQGEDLRSDLMGIAARILQRGVPGADVKATLHENVQHVTTDRDGYFRVHMRLARPLPNHRRWYHMELELLNRANPDARARGELLLPPDTARFVVVSDIDDTVVVTGVANKLKMLVRLFLRSAGSRVAFPGTAALYRALYQGLSGSDHNPMLYVSRGPWGIYEILEEFFTIHEIPVGPILFLREWGISWHRPFPRRSKDHKRNLIRNMLALYGEMPFVLIGDSGQHDPEIYTDIVRENPGRISAVYIRNVNHSQGRFRAIEELASLVAGQGSTLFLAADSFAMAEHMAQAGLIARHALADVMAERVQQQAGPDLKQTRKITRPSSEQTRQAVAKGDLKKALDEDAGDGGPPNIQVGKES